ncbi:MAG: DUF4300 family protein [Capnocytophaga sp.]|nr:DUF4300 family protein [Capnocytophaga sp.]MDO5105905.1 DUF4300 family protein [Capnocytophaga sp.]
MKKTFLVALLAILGAGCDNPQGKKAKNDAVSSEVVEQPFLKTIEYSNLVDKPTQNFVREALIAGGVRQTYADDFLEVVTDFNQTVGEAGLVADGFVMSDSLEVAYDVGKIITRWEAKHPVFPGYNCRLTSFGLFRDLISVGNPMQEKAKNLLIDADALKTNAQKTLTQAEEANFMALFASVPAENHKDVARHLQKMQEAFSERGIRFLHTGDASKASLVSVVFHSVFSDDPADIYLFIGHVGLLLPTENNKLLFIEKLAFDEPYQAIKFNNRTELNDYLMNRYDVDKGQSQAKPFLMENDALLEGYRPNPRNIEPKI